VYLAFALNGSRRLTLAIAVLLTAPLVIALIPRAGLLLGAHGWTGKDPALSQLYAHVVAALVLALPWGILFLVHMPHATARFAQTGRATELFDLPASIRAVTRDFATWNLAAAAIVTALSSRSTGRTDDGRAGLAEAGGGRRQQSSTRRHARVGRVRRGAWRLQGPGGDGQDRAAGRNRNDTERRQRVMPPDARKQQEEYRALR